MKLQKTTWGLLIIALLLGGFVYFYEIVGTPQREAAKEAEKQLFSFEEDEIERVNIYIQEESLKFERVNEPEPGWRMTEPKAVPASEPSVSFLLNLLVDGKSDRTIPNVSPESLKEYGLDKPQAMITVQLKNGETHEVLLGKPNFDQSFLYAQVDSFSDKSQQFNVFLVPMDFEYAVNRPLSEWEPTQAETTKETDSSDPQEKSTSEAEPTTKDKKSSESPAQPTLNNSDTETDESTPEPEKTPTSENKKPSASPSPENASSSPDKKPPIEEEKTAPSEEKQPEKTPNESEDEDVTTE